MNSEKQVGPAHIGDDEGVFEWKYAPPPTPYDLVRDSPLMRMARLGAHLILRWGVRHYNGLDVVNRENILANWPCIITPNHSSHLDTVAIVASLPSSSSNHTYALAAKDYFFRNPFIAFFARLIANVIPFDRTGGEKTGIKLALQKQEKGDAILIFPEGTRSTSGNMGQFKKEAVLLSRKAKMPIIPAYIQGTRESMPKSRSIPRRTKITVIFGQPVRYWEQPLSGLTDIEATQDLERRVQILSRETGQRR